MLVATVHRRPVDRELKAAIASAATPGGSDPAGRPRRWRTARGAEPGSSEFARRSARRRWWIRPWRGPGVGGCDRGNRGSPGPRLMARGAGFFSPGFPPLDLAGAGGLGTFFWL